jgi:hypothetical protein
LQRDPVSFQLYSLEPVKVFSTKLFQISPNENPNIAGDELKVKCPVCGIEGFLEQRGNNYRIKHYRGYKWESKTILNSQNQQITLAIWESMGIKTWE